MSSEQDFFETILVKDGVLQNVEMHAERIKNTLNYLNIKVIDGNELDIWIEENLYSKNYTEESVRLRINFTKSKNELTSFYKASKLSNYPSTIKLKFSNGPLKCSSDKNLNYKFSNLFRETTAPDSDFIFINEKDEVCETTKSNIYILRERSLITPPLSSGVLAGTYRAKLLLEGNIYIDDVSYSVGEKIILKDELKRAKGIFVSNALMGLKKAILV